MKTRRPISTISYNTDNYLEVMLNYMIDHGEINFWTYINHVPDEEVRKAHKHLYIMPDKQVDTSNIIALSCEFDLINPLPLQCKPFRYSKWDDWYLYSKHDKYYLKYKGLERHTFYKDEDFITNDLDYLHILVHGIDESPYRGYDSIIDAFYNGEKFADLIENGKIPLNRINQYSTVWKHLSDKNIQGIDREIPHYFNFKEAK